MSRKKYIIRRDEGLHLTDRQREILGTAWNQHVNRLVPISLRRRESLNGETAYAYDSRMAKVA